MLVVIKPARGEQGIGITVGVTARAELKAAVARARQHCADVLVEELHSGEDLRVIVIDHEVVAAAVRRPASIVGDGTRTVRDLIVRQSRRREAATDGESRIPLDSTTLDVTAQLHPVLIDAGNGSAECPTDDLCRALCFESDQPQVGTYRGMDQQDGLLPCRIGEQVPRLTVHDGLVETP